MANWLVRYDPLAGVDVAAAADGATAAVGAGDAATGAWLGGTAAAVGAAVGAAGSAGEPPPHAARLSTTVSNAADRDIEGSLPRLRTHRDEGAYKEEPRDRLNGSVSLRCRSPGESP